MVTAAERHACLHRAVAAVRGSSRLDAALRAVARALEPFAISRVSVRRMLPGGQRVEVAAVWVPGSTRLPAGTTMSVQATAFPEVLARDGPVVRSRDPQDQSLTDDILAEEGVQSWITMPLRGDDGTIDALFTVSSARTNAFEPDDGALFAELADAVNKLRSSR